MGKIKKLFLDLSEKWVTEHPAVPRTEDKDRRIYGKSQVTRAETHKQKLALGISCLDFNKEYKVH